MRLPDFLLPKNTALGRLVAKRRSFEASPLSRNSVELHKSRLQTRRCTLDNCRCHAGSGTAASECTAVLPRCAARERSCRACICAWCCWAVRSVVWASQPVCMCGPVVGCVAARAGEAHDVCTVSSGCIRASRKRRDAIMHLLAPSQHTHSTTNTVRREDSITLAKRRLSVDVLSTSGCESAAPAAHDASTSSGSSVTAAAAAAAPAAAPTGVQWGSDTDSHCSCASTACGARGARRPHAALHTSRPTPPATHGWSLPGALEQEDLAAVTLTLYSHLALASPRWCRVGMCGPCTRRGAAASSCAGAGCLCLQQQLP
jgi:hypothetical protein